MCARSWHSDGLAVDHSDVQCPALMTSLSCRSQKCPERSRRESKSLTNASQKGFIQSMRKRYHSCRNAHESCTVMRSKVLLLLFAYAILLLIVPGGRKDCHDTRGTPPARTHDSQVRRTSGSACAHSFLHRHKNHQDSRSWHLGVERLELLLLPLLLPVALVPLGSKSVEVHLYQVLRFTLVVVPFVRVGGLSRLVPVSPQCSRLWSDLYQARVYRIVKQDAPWVPRMALRKSTLRFIARCVRP